VNAYAPAWHPPWMNRTFEHVAKHEFEYVSPFSPHTGSYCKMHAEAQVNPVPNFSSSTRQAPGTTALARPAAAPKSAFSNAQFAQHAFAYVPEYKHTGSNASSTQRSRHCTNAALSTSNSTLSGMKLIGGKRVVPSGNNRAPSVRATNRFALNNVTRLRNLKSVDMSRNEVLGGANSAAKKSPRLYERYTDTGILFTLLFITIAIQYSRTLLS
jgi:hypothetical protein